MGVTALAGKLGIKSEEKALFLNIPATLQALSQAYEHDKTPEQSRRYHTILLFVHSQAELQELAPVALALAAAAPGAKLWIAYPKKSSAIKADINRDRGWKPVASQGWSAVSQIAIDNTWSALRFKPEAEISRKSPSVENGSAVGQQTERQPLVIPDDMQSLLDQHPQEKTFFDSLAYTHRKEYINWITGAKKSETRERRLEKLLEMLQQRKKGQY